MEEHLPWDQMKPNGSDPITKEDVKAGSRVLFKFQKTWKAAHKGGSEFPWKHLSKKIRICQILLRAGVDISVLDTAQDNVTDEHLPFSEDLLLALIPNDSRAQDIFRHEQARCFGVFSFDNPETLFKDNEFLPFLKVETGRLGDGTFSIVDKVRYVHARATGKPDIFARKCPKESRPDMTKALENEMKILKDLDKHHHIVEFVGSYKHGSEIGIILYPAAENGNLEQYLRGGHTIDDMLLMRLFGCLTMGLRFLNTACRLRHKDVKTSNILIHGQDVLFTDFGSAFKFTDIDGKTTNVTPGQITRRFAAPEIVGFSERNIKTDLFALGCIFAEVLSHLAGSSVQALHAHMRAGQKRRTSLSIRDPNLELPLKWCLQMLEDIEKRPHIVNLLADMKKHCEANYDLETFFCERCQQEFTDNETKHHNFAEEVQREGLSEAKQHINARDKFGLTRLDYAARNGDLDSVSLFLSHKADVKAVEPTESFTPLHWAVQSHHLEIVKLLLGSVSDARIKSEALGLAALKGDLEMVQHLLKKGAAVSEESTFGRSVLHQAALSNNADVVRVILKEGGDVTSTDNEGCTPLHLAAANGGEEIAKLLIDEMKTKNLDLDVPNIIERTPLHLAAFNGHVNIIKLLVGEGASINVRDIYHRMPIGLASLSENATVEKFLEDLALQRAEERRQGHQEDQAEGDGTKLRRKKISWAGENPSITKSSAVGHEEGINEDEDSGQKPRRKNVNWVSGLLHPKRSSDNIVQKAAPDVREITLYSSGSNAVLRSWSSPEGLVELENGLESVARTTGNIAEFQKNLQRSMRAKYCKHAEETDCAASDGQCRKIQIIPEIVDYDGDYDPLKSELDPEQLEAKEPWLVCMENFAMLLKNYRKPGCEESKVAIIDDGVDAAHGSLSRNIADGKSISKGHGGLYSSYYKSTRGHGTIMATLIRKVCPDARLYVAKLNEKRTDNGLEITADSAVEVGNQVGHFAESPHHIDELDYQRDNAKQRRHQ
ncbi:hypothetical protein NPX13_g1700 [Xylaria arbuscula]|uniref:Protein kinase domain-containing protein n=1 Tax=Xylaria arbuscula TaxID=114810 RepID=A0A9W8NKY2_9PEZI|nr:hypothetical protein NPX13_g1700 [Xylaria arbuscula]